MQHNPHSARGLTTYWLFAARFPRLVWPRLCSLVSTVDEFRLHVPRINLCHAMSNSRRGSPANGFASSYEYGTRLSNLTASLAGAAWLVSCDARFWIVRAYNTASTGRSSVPVAALRILRQERRQYTRQVAQHDQARYVAAVSISDGGHRSGKLKRENRPGQMHWWVRHLDPRMAFLLDSPYFFFWLFPHNARLTLS